MAEASGLYFEEHGPADAPPVILSSGLGGSARYWSENLHALAERFRIIAYDHRGTGRSDRTLPETVTVEQLADDILAIMDAASLSRASVVGHAAGGVAGLALALKAPERLDKLVVVNGWAKPDPHFLRCFEARLNLLRHAGVEAFLRAQPIFLYPADWISAHDAALNEELAHQIEGFPGVESMEKRIAALAAFDICDRVDRIIAPVLVVVTRDDMLVPASAGVRLASALPNARLEIVEHGGHASNVTDPATFNRIVCEFLGS